MLITQIVIINYILKFSHQDKFHCEQKLTKILKRNRNLESDLIKTKKQTDKNVWN